MSTFTALTTLEGKAPAEALGEAMERLNPEPTGVGVFEVEDDSGLWEVGGYFTAPPDEIALSLLAAVHAAVPEGVYFDAIDIDVDQSKVMLRGAGPTRREVRELVINLEQSPLLVDVEQSGGTTLDRNDRFRFQIVGNFERGKD